MRFFQIRPISLSVKILTAGALLAASAAAYVLPGASAAETNSSPIVALENASFWCSSNCSAEKLGPVQRGIAVLPSGSGANKIDSKKRNVVIHCRFDSEKVGALGYEVTVDETGWAGTWEIFKGYLEMKEEIDDSSYPICPDRSVG